MISKDVLKQVVEQQKFENSKPAETVRRELLDDILDNFKDNRILIVTGLRRSGKSTILKQIMAGKTDYCYVNFENEKFLDFEAQDFEILNEVLVEVYGNPKIYFFDEIQNIDKFETFVRRLQDQGKKIVITGSNASLLSKEFGTRLTGRYKMFEVYPFSFREYLLFKKIMLQKNWFFITEKKVEMLKAFQNYSCAGGLPEYLKNDDKEYIKTLYENILYRDIISRYLIKRQKTFKELVSILISNISSEITYNALKKTLKLSNAITVKEYISYLNNSYLFFEVQRCEPSIKRQLNLPKKIYAIDPAFIQANSLSFYEDKGKILENIVFIELKRSKKEIFFYSGKNECDFVIKKDRKVVEAIQVCYAFNEKNKKREINGLLEVMKRFNLKEGIILTQDQSEEMKIDSKNIKVIPVFKWLINIP